MQTPNPGQYWPEQSAHYAGPVAYPDGNVYALLLPDKPVFERTRQWGKYGTEIAGADSLHDGRANTTAMLTAGCPIAQKLATVDGELYLPSRIEALQLFATLKEKVGEGQVWTSTQYSACSAWYQDFGDGYQDIGYKAAELRAVAVRRLLLHSFSASAERAE